MHRDIIYNIKEEKGKEWELVWIQENRFRLAEIEFGHDDDDDDYDDDDDDDDDSGRGDDGDDDDAPSLPLLPLPCGDNLFWSEQK